jgi:prolipoprotein diacylglyceryltransferase
MRPILFTLLGVPVSSYAVFVGAAFLVAVLVRRSEQRRLGFDRDPRMRAVSLGALVGAMIGAKVGMLLFTPEAMHDLVAAMLRFDFSGKTVIGGLVGGYAGVELAKKAVGVTRRTGDTFAVAVPLAQAVGRVGCFLHGCCWGSSCALPWAVPMHDGLRHPVQLYEAALDLALAAWLFAIRRRDLPEGDLFRRYVVGYAAIRFTMEFFRGDPSWMLGPLNAPQWIAVVAGLGFAALLVRKEGARAFAPMP